MRHTTRQSRENRTLTVDFQNEATYLSAETQSHLSRGRMPDPPLALRPGPAGWAHSLAGPVHDVSRGVHRAPALCLTLSPDATGGGP